MKTIAVVLVALVGIVCGRYNDYYYSNTGYPYGGSNYPRGGGSSYPYPGPGYPLTGQGNDLDLPPYCSSLNCVIPACDVERCPYYPYARCVGFCNSCVARFFYRGVHVTKFCHARKPNKKY
ncbi:uncharacterized protein LOC111099641 [Crassostrea virginica]|uniref:Uncharacterized protein LOC111099641 n=1 Tax=Crassostrea virginica TaxID=6565 RepID=A0A8B8AA16_CRAVI|nr:uncharacterized protein LOC111099641 [Crassostrea virginica]